jgi:hypothetical protein
VLLQLVVQAQPHGIVGISGETGTADLPLGELGGAGEEVEQVSECRRMQVDTADGRGLYEKGRVG